MPDKSHRYSASMIVIHWLTALLVLGAWFHGEGGRKIAENPPLLHFSLWLAVLVLMLPRLVLRVAGRTPETDAQGWLAAAAKAGHAVLYLFMIALPITGWYAASRMGVPVSFFGCSFPRSPRPFRGEPA